MFDLCKLNLIDFRIPESYIVKLYFDMLVQERLTGVKSFLLLPIDFIIVIWCR